MRIRIRTLFIVWVLLTALALWALIDSLSAGRITRPLIPQSNLKWSSYHAYHCIIMWEGDRVTYSASRIRQTLKACKANKKWANKMVKRLKLRKCSVKKKVSRIFNYITEGYDYDSAYIWLEQARRSGVANCSAYADLFYALCKAAKVPVRYVIGRTHHDDGTQGTHCWNRVKIKKRWYWIDCTWGLWISKKLWKTHGWIVEEW